MANVRFYFGTQKKYDSLVEKNPIALYFIEDTQRLYKGDVLMATGADATSMASGLMSHSDKIKLDSIAEIALSGLSPVDGSIIITEGVDGGKNIGVAIAKQDNNALTLVDGGLFVPVAKEIEIPEYSIEKQTVADEGFSASYKLKKTVNGEASYVGDTINIAKDMVLQSASMKTVEENNIPYDGAVVGDPYIEMIFNDEKSSTLYIPMTGLVDSYTAGNGIEIVDGRISVKIASESNGLVAVDGALSIALATKDSAGALSPVDKAFIDSIPTTYATIERVKKTTEQVKYEVAYKPEGTVVNYGEDEIRVMCPANTKWVKQNVGATGNANMYYMGFKAYAPEGAVSFKEGDKGKVDDEMFDFTDDFAGTDEFGRNYSIVWLALASYDESSDTWTYFGKNSSVEKYLGWDYIVEWYDAKGIMIATDSIRINLSNEECHNVNVPYYMSKYATIDDVNQSMVWGEL